MDEKRHVIAGNSDRQNSNSHNTSVQKPATMTVAIDDGDDDGDDDSDDKHSRRAMRRSAEPTTGDARHHRVERGASRRGVERRSKTTMGTTTFAEKTGEPSPRRPRSTTTRTTTRTSRGGRRGPPRRHRAGTTTTRMATVRNRPFRSTGAGSRGPFGRRNPSLTTGATTTTTPRHRFAPRRGSSTWRNGSCCWRSIATSTGRRSES